MSQQQMNSKMTPHIGKPRNHVKSMLGQISIFGLGREQ